MDFTTTLKRAGAMMTEGAVAERLRRRDDLSLHPMLFNTPLIYDEHGRAAMAEIYGQYRDLAAESGLPILLCAPTWRVDRDRIARAGFTEDLNRDAVEFMRSLQQRWNSEQSPLFVGGLVGPKNDCYTPADALGEVEAEEYHLWQVRELVEAGVDCIVAQTFPAVSEALGVARACARAKIPYLISFVIDRGGLVLDGSTLPEAISRIDANTSIPPTGYMVNCVFPSFIGAANQPAELFARLVGIQANASSKSHDQLENSAELQQDSLEEWGKKMLELNVTYGMKILGGCCGTDQDYIGYLTRELSTV